MIHIDRTPGGMRPANRMVLWVLLSILALGLAACGNEDDVESVAASFPVHAWYASPPSSVGVGSGAGYSTVTTRFKPSVGLAIMAIYYQYGNELVLYRGSDMALVWSAPVPNITAPSLTWRYYGLDHYLRLTAGETYYIGVHTDGVSQWLGFPPTNFPHGTIDTTNAWASGAKGFPAGTDPSYLSWTYPIYTTVP